MPLVGDTFPTKINVFVAAPSFGANDVYDSLVNQKIVFANIQFAFGTNDMCLGYQANVTANTNMMNYQELIIYSSDELSNRTGIETNINNFYSIYP